MQYILAGRKYALPVDFVFYQSLWPLSQKDNFEHWVQVPPNNKSQLNP